MLLCFIAAGVALLALFVIAVRRGDDRMMLLFIGCGVAVVVLFGLAVAVVLAWSAQDY